MRTQDGTLVMVTPNVLYGPSTAVLAVDAGEEGHIFIRHDGLDFSDGEDRHCYVAVIYDSNGQLIGEVDDLKSGTVHSESGHTPEEMLRAARALLSFLTACAESKDEESENYHLFERPVREWAEMVSDELSVIWLEINQELGEDTWLLDLRQSQRPQWLQEALLDEVDPRLSLSDCMNWETNEQGDCGGRLFRRDDGSVLCENCANRTILKIDDYRYSED